MRNMLRFAAVIGAIVVAVGVASAERSSGNSENRREQVRDRAFTRIAEKLELDEATTTKLKEIMAAQTEARKKLAEEMKAESKKLKELVEKNATAEELNAQIDLVEAKRNAMHELTVNSGREVRTLLGPQKYAKWLVMQSKVMQGMRERQQGNRSNRGDGNRPNRNNRRDDD